jgi:hypothetical protein
LLQIARGGSPTGLAFAHLAMTVALLDIDPTTARTHAELADRSITDAASPLLQILQRPLAMLEAHDGNLTTALEINKDAIDYWHKQGMEPMLLQDLEIRLRLESLAGEHYHAAVIEGFLDASETNTNPSVSFLADQRPTIAKALAPDDHAQAHQQGGQLTIDQIVQMTRTNG